MKKIPVLIESKNGHDEKLVPQSKLQEEVTNQVKDGKWATLEKTDGSTEVVTEDDLDDEDKELQAAANWGSLKKDKGSTPKPVKSSTTKSIAKKFEKVQSVTCTSKAKGG
jgi:hypothetical protein